MMMEIMLRRIRSIVVMRSPRLLMVDDKIRGFIVEERSWVLDKVNILPALLQIRDSGKSIWDVSLWFICRKLTHIQLKTFALKSTTSRDSCSQAPSTKETDLCNDGAYPIKTFSHFLWIGFKPTLRMRRRSRRGWVISVGRLLLLQLCLVPIGAPPLPQPHTFRLFQFPGFFMALSRLYCWLSIVQLLYTDYGSS